ncbi:MAG TPA: glycosyltransferase family 2 protein [Bryobacteraceae bacterium]|nr:glycosyltransferase family 2 protein [Bryobacteraceae bacterium]
MLTPQLSIVSTMYCSSEFIVEFHRRMSDAARQIAPDYEIILVDDGSPDDSLARALALADTDPHVRVVELSRNFGHHPAMLAGLRHARGEFVFLIDIDLEEKPEWLADFWHDLDAGKADIVYGVQSLRAGSAMKRHTGTLFYRIFNAVSDIAIPANGCTVRLMRRAYVDALDRFHETHVFLMGLFSWAGFRQQPRLVTKTRRPSESTYTPMKLIALSLEAVTSFSSYPLTIIFVFGACITLLALAFAAWLFIYKLARPAYILSGFTSLMVSLWFLGGIIISVLGIIGMYIGRIFVEAKSRPQYLVRRVYGD